MTESEKIAIMREGAGFLARIWKRMYAPVSHEESVFVDGVWVRISIDFDKTRNGHRPARRADDIEEIMSDRSQDA